MKKIVIGLAVILIIIVIGLVSSKNKSSDVSLEPIVIGAVLSFSGPAASYGEFTKNGMDLAASEINARGGIDGRVVKVIYEDDKTDPKTAVSAYNKLVHVDNVDVVIGGLWDFTAQPLIPLALENRITFITPSNFRIEGALELNEQSFAMLTDFNKVIRKLEEYLKRDDVKKVADIQYKSAWGVEIAKTIGEITQKYGKEMIDEPYASVNSMDFRTIVAKLKQQNVDTVFFDTVDQNTVNLLMRSNELGFKPKFLTYVGSYDGLPAESKSLLEGVVVLNWERTAPQFTKLYQNAYGVEPARSADKAYDAVYVASEAVAKSKTRADVASYIESHRFETVNGPIEFLPTHQVATTPVQLDIYEEGELIPLEN